MILITDGYDENSAGDLETTLQSGARAAGGGVRRGHRRRRRHLAERRAAAAGAGGEDRRPHVLSARAKRSWWTCRRTVSAECYSRYLISYTPANQTKDGTWREDLGGGAGRLRVRTRAGYFAPKPPPIRPTLEFTVDELVA